MIECLGCEIYDSIYESGFKKKPRNAKRCGRFHVNDTTFFFLMLNIIYIASNQICVKLMIWLNKDAWNNDKKLRLLVLLQSKSLHIFLLWWKNVFSRKREKISFNIPLWLSFTGQIIYVNYRKTTGLSVWNFKNFGEKRETIKNSPSLCHDSFFFQRICKYYIKRGRSLEKNGKKFRKIYISEAKYTEKMKIKWLWMRKLFFDQAIFC